MDREVEEPPPFVVLVHGPPGVGKTTIIKNLVKHYTRQSISEVKGPITLISGKQRRLTLIECPQVIFSDVEFVRSLTCNLCREYIEIKVFKEIPRGHAV